MIVEFSMPVVSWSAIAGGLNMPAEFACMFQSGSSVSPVANRLNVPNEFASVFQSESHGASTAGSSNCHRVVQARRVRPRCVFCGGIHDELMPCACFRCGRRHQGDCPTVCSLCGGCHMVSSRCRQSSGLPRLTSRRRTLSVFSNDDYDYEQFVAIRHNLGSMSVECPHCQARKWVSEKLNCCHGGDVVVPWDVEVPSGMSDVILSSHVRKNIRSYNTVMAFASTGHQNKSIVGGTFVLGGRTYHRIGSLLPGYMSHGNEFVLCSHTIFFRIRQASFFFSNLDLRH